MPPLSKSRSAIKEWIPDDDPDLNWFNQERESTAQSPSSLTKVPPGNPKRYRSTTAASWSSTTTESQVHQTPTKKPLQKKISPMRPGKLSSPSIIFAQKSPGSATSPANSGGFLPKTPPVDSPNLPLFPLSTPSAPVQRRLQGSPAKSKLLAVVPASPVPDVMNETTLKRLRLLPIM